ncbi:MAG TPA: cytochrome c oxidase assembly protein [Gaiellaceae bacterium]|nr:cytochrome c oxidase assembly protein [Gaiellaceae bacterium]
MLLAHGDAVPVDELWRAWSLQPVPVALALVAALLFAQGYVRLRRRSPAHAGRDRPVLFALALVAGVLPLVSPLDPLGDEYLLSMHMVEHVLIGDVAPALAMVALRGPLVFFFLPPALLRPLASLGWLRAAGAFLLRPVAAFSIWACVVAGWHVPVSYDFALAHERVHDLEHLTFVIAGTLVWAVLADPARRRALTEAGRIFYAWGLFVTGHLATHLILFDSKPHYAPYIAQDERLLGLTPLADQYWAGIAMTIEELLAFGILTAILVRRIPRPETARSTEVAP